MAIDRSWSPAYLQKQKEAMWWLCEQGLTPEEIREMKWGAVDDGDKAFLIRRMVTFEKIDLSTWQIERTEYQKAFKIPLRGTECEWYFLKSKIPCPWMFTSDRTSILGCVLDLESTSPRTSSDAQFIITGF